MYFVVYMFSVHLTYPNPMYAPVLIAADPLALHDLLTLILQLANIDVYIAPVIFVL